MYTLYAFTYIDISVKEEHVIALLASSYRNSNIKFTTLTLLRDVQPLREQYLLMIHFSR